MLHHFPPRRPPDPDDTTDPRDRLIAFFTTMLDERLPYMTSADVRHILEQLRRCQWFRDFPHAGHLTTTLAACCHGVNGTHDHSCPVRRLVGAH